MASSKRVWFARAGSIRRGFFISISRSDGGRAFGHALTNLERRSARRRLYHCWPCTRERAGPRRERYSLTPLRSPETEIGFAPETIAPHSRSAAHFFSWRDDDRLSDIARARGPGCNRAVGDVVMSEETELVLVSEPVRAPARRRTSNARTL